VTCLYGCLWLAARSQVKLVFDEATINMVMSSEKVALDQPVSAVIAKVISKFQQPSAGNNFHGVLRLEIIQPACNRYTMKSRVMVKACAMFKKLATICFVNTTSTPKPFYGEIATACPHITTLEFVNSTYWTQAGKSVDWEVSICLYFQSIA